MQPLAHWTLSWQKTSVVQTGFRVLLLAEQFTADLAYDAAFHDSKQALWVFARPAYHDSCGLMQVENVALLANAKDTGFVGVNLYCDDEAGIMGAQANLRASDIANCCGKPLEVGGAGLARSHHTACVLHLVAPFSCQTAA